MNNDHLTPASPLEAIRQGMQLRLSEMQSDLTQYRQTQTALARQAAEEAYEEYLRQERLREEAAQGTLRSGDTTDTRAGIVRTRFEITERVFAAAAERLKAFTETPDYADFLTESTQRMKKFCSGKAFTVYMRTADLIHADDVRAVSRAIDVKTDDGIRLGGLRAVCAAAGIELDDTLDARLQAQRDWFYEHSGLTV